MAAPEANERNTVTRVCAGHADAAERLYELCRPVTRSLYYQLGLAGKCSEDDLLNDLFLHLVADRCHILKTWKGESSLKTWLFVVARRHFGRGLAREARYKPLTDELRDLQPSRSADPADAASVTDDALIQAKSVSELLRAIEKLESELERRVILMYCNGRPPTEIAKLLGVTPGTARVIKHRAPIVFGTAFVPPASGRFHVFRRF